MEHQNMDAQIQEPRDYGFVIGLLAGTCLGAGLAVWLAPRAASEIRQRITDSAVGLGDKASERYQRVSTRVTDTVDELARRGHEAADQAADAVARGAHEVERYATEARSTRVNHA